MRLGAVFPTTEIGSDPIGMRDYAQAAEALGCVRLTTYDHVLGVDHADREPALRGPYTHHDPFHEPFVLFGFLAAYTTRIELATGVLVLPQRQTALVAKQAAEVDVLSGGRMVLGVGTGWNHVEYASLGTTFRDRARRLDDQIAVLRALWEQDLVEHESDFHMIDRAGVLPRPARSIPIWLGGSAEASLQRAARLGDGHIFAGNTDRHFACRVTAVRDPRRAGPRPRVLRHRHVRGLRRRPGRVARQGAALGGVRGVAALDALDDDRHGVPGRPGR